jgi:hypothetical protein
LISNIHILPQTSLPEHYTALLLEGRDGVGRQGWRRRRKEGDRGKMRTRKIIQNKGGKKASFHFFLSTVRPVYNFMN